MTEQLSLWELISNASLLVQFVMLLLVLASVVSWIMIIQRGIYLRQAHSLFREFEQMFWSGVDLNELFREGSQRLQNNRMVSGAEAVFRAGFREFNRLTKKGSPDPDAIIEGTERAMRVALSREEEKLNANLPFLASVASTSPYIGLFGTVWGIMQSFRGLANVQQATLAVVAPGISEALIATAMGLFAAIPAVLAFNRYSARAENLFGGYQTFAEEFSSILHRRVHSK
ncbi:MAG: protein TolQ [Porticoccaceae bacterium]|nr:protein TolQ [Porticoccaceae bacterium]